jgi:hypothetical protein
MVYNKEAAELLLPFID